jgi:hypothetical protein
MHELDHILLQRPVVIFEPGHLILESADMAYNFLELNKR